ncbi:hypothetical protein [Photorhabdus viridis]|uniref:hypothetical protein n=1 Tax=Photorhabdus viridis TaxID=3163327 RepID=UPI00330783A8
MFKIRKKLVMKIIAKRTGFGFQATLFSTPTLSDAAYAASDGEKRRVSTAMAAACSPQSAIADNTWYLAQLAARPHVAVSIFLPSGRGKRLAPTPTRGT